VLYFSFTDPGGRELREREKEEKKIWPCCSRLSGCYALEKVSLRVSQKYVPLQCWWYLGWQKKQWYLILAVTKI
jgi:hypothetical protein